MDAVLLVLALLAVSVPFLIAKLYWWVAFWLVLSAVLGIFEAIAAIATKRTISQQFWKWVRNPDNPKWQKILIFMGMVLFWVYLLWHLFG